MELRLQRKKCPTFPQKFYFREYITPDSLDSTSQKTAITAKPSLAGYPVVEVTHVQQSRMWADRGMSLFEANLPGGCREAQAIPLKELFSAVGAVM